MQIYFNQNEDKPMQKILLLLYVYTYKKENSSLATLKKKKLVFKIIVVPERLNNFTDLFFSF